MSLGMVVRPHCVVHVVIDRPIHGVMKTNPSLQVLLDLCSLVCLVRSWVPVHTVLRLMTQTLVMCNNLLEQPT